MERDTVAKMPEIAWEAGYDSIWIPLHQGQRRPFRRVRLL